MGEIYQVYVKLLTGNHKALNFTSPSISVLSVKHRLFDLTGIPIDDQRLVAGTGHLTDQSSLSPADGTCSFPVLHLLLRLRGGKGGFGSLLRGAATKAGQKKTNNFDACRDMSGRRLRHVNAEKKLEEWKAEAEERRLEKAAEEFLRKKMKAEGKKIKEGGVAETEKYVKKYREDSARCMEEVEKSVREALGKRKMKVGKTSGSDSKKLKIWLGMRKADNSDSDEADEDDSDEDEEEEKDDSIVLDGSNHSGSNKEAECSSGSVTGGKMDGTSSSGASSENSLDGDEETVVGGALLNGGSPGAAMVEEIVEQNAGVSSTEETVVSGPELICSEKQGSNETESYGLNGIVGQPLVTSSLDEEKTTECQTDAEASPGSESKPAVYEETAAMSTAVVDLVNPFNFDEFNSSEELEALGMEKLKSALQSRGLKCGGTLQERAARLFLLKVTPLEKLPKKLFAKK